MRQDSEGDGGRPAAKHGPGFAAAAFSLVEVLIVVSLLAIVVSISYPAVRTAYVSRIVGRTVDEFVSQHDLARATAIRLGRTSRLHLDAGSGKLWVAVDTSMTGSGDTTTVGRVLEVGDDGTSFYSTRTVLCFDARGLPTLAADCDGADASVTFSLGSVSKTVTVTAAGRLIR